MQCRGGFAWWYLDLVDENGSGLVLIWSFGLPFLPPLDRPVAPQARPSVCLATYDRGRPGFYLLHEVPPEKVSFDGDTWCFGDTVIERVRRNGRESWVADLSMPIPGDDGQLRGTIRVDGPQMTLPANTTAQGHASVGHHWAPITTSCPGVADLAWPGGGFSTVGRAYVDSNASARPLQALGIRRWRWARLALPGRELIFYLLDPTDLDAPSQSHVIEVAADGRMRMLEAEVSFGRPSRSVYGPRFHRRVSLHGPELDIIVDQSALVDDGPFYLRFLCEARDRSGEVVGHGVSELVLPERIDVPWQRPFVRMRSHRAERDNSMWLPLFSGPREGRVRRLFRQWGRQARREVRV